MQMLMDKVVVYYIHYLLSDLLSLKETCIQYEYGMYNERHIYIFSSEECDDVKHDESDCLFDLNCFYYMKLYLLQE